MAQTAPIVGKSGAVHDSGTEIAEITAWNVDYENSIQETTAFDSGGTRDYEYNLTGWSGSCEGNWYVGQTSSKQLVLQNAVINGTKLYLQLYVDDTGGATFYYSGQALITAFHVAQGVDAKADMSFDYTGTGALVFVST